jgi:membrane protein YqaA with SNARE-associated domain
MEVAQVFSGLYQWAKRHAEGAYGLWVLGIVSFLESALLPLPVDAVGVPIMLAQKRRIFRIALMLTISSVLGGALGFAIGYYFYDLIGAHLVEMYGWQDLYQDYQVKIIEHSWLIILIGAITPLPFKLICIACGAASLSPVTFLLASVVGRGLRFYGLAALLHLFGPPVRRFIDQRPGLSTSLAVGCLVFGFLLLMVL